MKFEVMRNSDYEAGRVGADVQEPPLPRAQFNADEVRWEIEIADLQDLLTLTNGEMAMMVLPPVDDGDLPMLSLLDVEEVEEGSTELDDSN